MMKLDASDVHRGGGHRLSDDLLIEILAGLPFKSLARFKCVSKACNTLISDPDFQKRLPTNMMQGLVYQQWRTNIPGEIGYVSVPNPNCSKSTESDLMDLDLTFCPTYPNLRLMGCTNGLLLLLHGSARPPSPYVYHGNLIPPHPDVFYVCNPITRRWVALPECPRTKNWYDSVLVFDPKRSPHFKVIRIGVSLRSSSLELTIFCSKTGSWGVVNSTTTTTTLHRHRLVSRGIVSSDGIIYRMAYPQTLLRINVEDIETCTEIKLPGKATPFPRFGLCAGGNLRCAQIVDGSRLQVWELKNSDGIINEWVLKHSKFIMEAALISQNIERSGAVLILLAFHLDIEDIVYVGVCNKIISYNVDSDMAEEIFSCSEQYYQASDDLRLHPFRPSFLDCLPDVPHNW